MSITSSSRSFNVLVDLAALPVIGLLVVASAVSLVLGDPTVLAWTALSIALLDALLLATFIIGGKPLRPLSESSLLFQTAAPVGRLLVGALVMVASSFLGAITAVYVTADAAGFQGWFPGLVGPVLAFALILGTLGSAFLVSRRVFSLGPRARGKAMRRGVRRVTRALGGPVITLDEDSVVVRHLSTTWYLLWVPFLALLVAAIGMLVTLQ